MRLKNKTSQFEQFDLFKFMDAYHIGYSEHTKNVGNSWVGLDECPFCGITGNHIGINIQSKGYFCWGCGNKGSLFSLIKELLNINGSETFSIINEFFNGDLEFVIKETGDSVILPSNVMDLMKSGGDYLKSRGYNPVYIRDKFQVKQTSHQSTLSHQDKKSDFKNRLIIPIYMNRKLVSYTGRDYTGIGEPKYKHVFIEACIVPPSSCLYNIDTVKDKCIIVEGPLDVWRMGDGVISLQGIETTKEQIRRLAEYGIKKAVILFDSGKEEKAKKLAKILSSVIKLVQVASLPRGDPGELGDLEALQIKHQLLGE